MVQVHFKLIKAGLDLLTSSSVSILNDENWVIEAWNILKVRFISVSYVMLIFFFFFSLSFFFFFFLFFFIFKLYITVLDLPNIKINPPQVYMCSPSWTLLPPPSPFHPSGSYYYCYYYYYHYYYSWRKGPKKAKKPTAHKKFTEVNKTLWQVS